MAYCSLKTNIYIGLVELQMLIINIGNKVILMRDYKITSFIEPNYTTIKSFFFTLYFKILSATGSFINIFNQTTSID